ncbi:MAG: DUF4129 domain-containing protein [Bacteroidota bacterium]
MPSPLRLVLPLCVLAVLAGLSPALGQTKPDAVAPSTRDAKIERAAEVASQGTTSVLPAIVSDLPRDSSALTPLVVPTDALDAFRADPDFAYDRVVVQQPSVWERIQRWFIETFLRPADDAIPEDVQRWIVYGLAIALLVFAVLKLLGADFGGVFQRRETTVATVEALDEIEAIEDVDLDRLLGEAERAETWPLAVRLRHLRLLQRLAAQDLIAWAPAKTDRAYLLDLEGGPRADLVPAVRDLTRLFQAAWYGDFDVDEALYADVRARFEDVEGDFGDAQPSEVG